MEETNFQPQPLSPEALRCVCDPAQFDFATTDDLPYNTVTIGQDRAVEALHFGLNIHNPGFNIYVMGSEGTGRRSIIRRVVEALGATAPTPHDWVYVNHFSDPRRPRAISLPTGQGNAFRNDMERFNAELVERIPRAFETDAYAAAREEQAQALRALQQQELTQVERACAEQGFALVRAPSGIYLAPLREGEILTPETFSQLPQAEREVLDQHHAVLQEALNGALRRIREQEREIQTAVEELDRRVAEFALEPLLGELQEKYAGQIEVLCYLDEVQQDVLDNITALRGQLEDESDDDMGRSLLDVPLWQRYRVNVLVDNSATEGAPVIIEENPTYENLLGRIEYDVRYGSTVTDYTLIRSGALHRANGGYLILNAEALLNSPYAWEGLKRALASSTARIERPDAQQLVSTITPEPEPISLRVKVVLVGSVRAFYAFYRYDEEFGELFKVRVDFATEMERTPENERAYADFIRARSEEENLLPFTPDAVARVVEYGSRLAEDQEQLSCRFGMVADLVREASYWARQAGDAAVSAAQVRHALAQQIRRASLDEELVRREILEGRLVVATAGEAVGEVNGLTVSIAGGYVYGMPTRITARAYTGRGSVVDIHRETRLGGPIHSKGVLTLTGYIGGQYGVHRPLSMEASLSFEQIYDEIDGDSASAAELFALLSALAEIPLRQDLAVTGAVDQVGRILPIGLVNEKIEGFFDVCRARELTGTQGVVIPATNVENLMLREDVVAAVAAGRFHIYPIHTVDEGLTLLTGIPAGTRDEVQKFPEGSVHAMVDHCLRTLGHRVRTNGEDRPCPVRPRGPRVNRRPTRRGAEG